MLAANFDTALQTRTFVWRCQLRIRNSSGLACFCRASRICSGGCAARRLSCSPCIVTVAGELNQAGCCSGSPSCSSDVDGHLRAVYGDMLIASHEGADVTLQVDSSKLPAGKSPAEVASLVASLRRHALGAPFDRALKSVATKGAAPVPETMVKLRPREPVFVMPRGDRVAVIYTLHFADATDRAIARVICQEFVEAQRHISTAPPVNYSDKEPPLELRGRADLLKHTEESFVGYLTFSMLPRQFDSDAKRANVVHLLVQFRTYLDYHIKAAKSYLHSRMRGRVDGWMQVREAGGGRGSLCSHWATRCSTAGLH